MIIFYYDCHSSCFFIFIFTHLFLYLHVGILFDLHMLLTIQLPCFFYYGLFCIRIFAFYGLDSLFFLYHILLFIEYGIISEALTCLTISADGLYTVFQCVGGFCKLESVSVERFLFSLFFALNMLVGPFLWFLPFFLLYHLSEGNIEMTFKAGILSVLAMS